MSTDITLFALEFAQLLLILAFAPLIVGLIRKTKAEMQGRKGPPVLQPYRDLYKLFRKDEEVSEHASWLFFVAPYICVGSMILAASMVPVIHTLVIGPGSDLILILYLMMLSRVMLVLSSLEGGSSFGGMAGSRETMLSALIEPALLLSVFALVALSGSAELGAISTFINNNGFLIVGPTLLLAGASFCITLMAENARMPFDNPATHLELTMVHEGMILEYSGKGLALMEYASWLKLTVFMVILMNGFFPWGIAIQLSLIPLLISLLALSLKLGIVIVLISLLESRMAKMRLFRLPNLLTASFILALLAMMTFYIL